MTDTQLCLATYGDPTKKAFVDKWMVRHELPAAVKPYFPKYGNIRPTAVYMNRYATEALDAVLLDLLATGLIKELKTYDGCFNVRLKRGVNEYSIHSWGLALDFNAMLNPLGVKMGSRKGMFTDAFLAVWRKHKWVCGADWKYADGMHFQFTSSYPKK
ncbi:M15 family metallopeptidase [Hymenobacter guriensis]|uniref:M15 family metallopeptidase n=1 Tax=Hymenobacter guriensis TaxID=2793065 RepID=A0ABS0KWX9_9BACT|nr:M15 family metallopeptidase [Hymenobacter guriensis]MBG8552369.1 M15 family metallopeptidase [Hymenobacter guriensis]